MPYEYYYEYPGYEYPDVELGYGAGFGGVIVAFIVTYYFLMIALCMAAYVFQSLSLYTIAKRRGLHNPWLSWLPVGNMWILGSISDQYQYVAKGRIRNRRKLLVGLTVALFVLLFLIYAGVIGMILGIAGEAGALAGGGVALTLLAGLAALVTGIVAAVYQYIAVYDLYASCDPDNKVLFLVLSVFFAVAMPVFFFVCRKKDLGMPPRKSTPVLQLQEETFEQQTEE